MNEKGEIIMLNSMQKEKPMTKEQIVILNGLMHELGLTKEEGIKCTKKVTQNKKISCQQLTEKEADMLFQEILRYDWLKQEKKGRSEN